MEMKTRTREASQMQMCEKEDQALVSFSFPRSFVTSEKVRRR